MIWQNNKPYSLPINFAYMDENIYFHGSKSGRKIKILKQNSYASFSVVRSYSLIQSYFSSTDNLACPSTQFFKSIIIDGEIEFVEDYKKAINTTTIYKLIPKETKAKFKFGQHLSDE